MIKKILQISFIIITSVYLINTFSFAAEKAATEKVLSGRIIDITEEYIELKKGRKEILLYFNNTTQFISTDGSEGSKEILAVCQYAKAIYIPDRTKNTLLRIEITKDSDCLK